MTEHDPLLRPVIEESIEQYGRDQALRDWMGFDYDTRRAAYSIVRDYWRERGLELAVQNKASDPQFWTTWMIQQCISAATVHIGMQEARRRAVGEVAGRVADTMEDYQNNGMGSSPD